MLVMYKPNIIHWITFFTYPREKLHPHYSSNYEQQTKGALPHAAAICMPIKCMAYHVGDNYHQGGVSAVGSIMKTFYPLFGIHT